MQNAKINLLLLTLLASLGLNIFLLFGPNDEHADPNSEADANTSTKTITLVDNDSRSLPDTDNEPSQQLSNQATAHFSQFDFESAVGGYASFIHQDEAAAERMLEDWMVQVRNWLRTGRMKRAESFINAFLDFQPYNLDVLQLEAMRLSFINQTSEAISVYQTIVDNSLDSDVQRAMLQQIHAIVSQQQLSLQKTGQWQSLIDFVEPLIYDEPDYLPYQLMVAEAMVELEQFEGAKAYLQDLKSYDDYSVQAESLLAKIAQSELGKQAIALTQLGAHYLVAGKINNQADTALMIDTGASLSVLTQRAFDQLPLWQSPQYIRNANMRTAGGTVNAPIYRFEQFEIGGYRVSNIDFVVMDMEDFDHADGLLGMNYLRNFEFQIDQQRHLLLLKYR